MDVQVTKNGEDITGHVISYDREHKICTGIGMLEMEIDYTYGGVFDPWDEINIYENGTLSGQYFVSICSEAQPNASFTVTAQDNSKRLSDYFISDSYTVDYPSYSSFWIGYFLDEMGIPYRFLSNDPGSLLSNNTALGLMTGYEQIMMLVQMNGWYFTFTYNGVCLIGKANADFGNRSGSFGNDTIIDIKTIKSDKMLRNRVVVWGKGDPEHGRWVFADVLQPTKWDYDSKDRRTIVVSNSNIRHNVDAFALANKALIEFARITVEKHITLEGAKNLTIGDVVGIKNKTFSGSGKVTTFGTSMSKNGLVTNIILDERCPRLFGFFDIGGWVYVGTFGSGVWRKHILPSWSGGSGLLGFASGLYEASGWYPYSSGLGDMNVTDLHVNAGVLVSVTSSGQAWYSLEDEHPWSGIPISGLTVRMSGMLIPLSGGGYDGTVYSSGLMARACIIDRDTNMLRIAVDTRSGINLGDFLMETNPLQPIYFDPIAYVLPSGGYSPELPSGLDFRSWVLDVNPYSGGQQSYPVGVSGNYDYWVYDIENDGYRDYVEGMTFGSGNSYHMQMHNGFYQEYTNWYSIGSTKVEHINRPGTRYNERNNLINMLPYSGYPNIQTTTYNLYGRGASLAPNFDGVCYVEDNTPYGEAIMAFSRTGTAPTFSTNRFLEVFVTRILPNGSVSTSSYSTDTGYGFTNTAAIAILKLSSSRIRLAMRKVAGNERELIFIDFDYLAGTTAIKSVSDALAPRSLIRPFEYMNWAGVVDGDVYYQPAVILGNDYETPGGPAYEFKFGIYKTNLITGALIETFVEHLTENPTKSFEKLAFDIAPAKNGYSAVFIYTEVKWYSPTIIGMTLKRVSAINGEVRHYEFDHEHYYGRYERVQPADIYTTGCRINRIGEDKWTCMYSIGWTYTVDVYGGIVNFIDAISFTLDSETSDLSDRFTGAVSIEIPNYALSERASDNSYHLVNWYDLRSYKQIEIPSGYTSAKFAGIDTINKEIYFTAVNAGQRYVIATDPGGHLSRRTNYSSFSITPEEHFIRGNFRMASTAQGSPMIAWVYPIPIPVRIPSFQVLQRDNYDFAVVKSGLYRDRLDISNYSPLVTMDRRLSSAEIYYISLDNSVTMMGNPAMSGYNIGNVAMSGVTVSGSIYTMGILADDFRYAGLDNVAESGFSSNLFVVFNGQLGTIDMSTFESMSGLFISTSGSIARIETSNYVFPDQYQFVAMSGYTGSGVLQSSGVFPSGNNAWGFFQKDPVSGVWVDYSSGYPQARTTIIRLDDSI